MKKPLLFIISSPSGAGKTTLCKRLLSEFADIRFSVSVTTRPPRPNERNGVDYTFVSEAEFAAMLDAEQFAEWAVVHGHSYGTPHAEIRAAANQEMDLIFDIDYQGARQIKQHYPEAVAVFILPPSIEELRRRLDTRGTETPESLERRFQAALGEISHYEEFDYLVLNDDIDKAYDRLRSVVVAQRCHQRAARDLAKRLLDA